MDQRQVDGSKGADEKGTDFALHTHGDIGVEDIMMAELRL